MTARGSAAEPSTLDALEGWLALVKGELKGYNPDTGELRIELQDSNRPDLWCCEGIARQIRIKRQGKPSLYAWSHERFDGTTPRLDVMPGLESMRPYVAACLAVGYRVTEDGLTQLIQTQEKLADIFGRKRRSVSIGLYRLPRITFPVTYGLVAPDEFRFTPLGLDAMMTPAEILMVHPKGLEYGAILAPDHYYELSHYFSPDPQEGYQVRMFFATKNFSLAYRAIEEAQDLETMIVISGKGGYNADRLYELLPYVVFDREKIPFDRLYQLLGLYADFPHMLIEAPEDLF